jgi:hypothetical protein
MLMTIANVSPQVFLARGAMLMEHEAAIQEKAMSEDPI